MAKRAATKKRATRSAPAKTTAITTMRAAAPARAALGAASADNDSNLLTEGFIDISIGDKTFELRGVVGAYVKVDYQVSFEKAEPLGTIPDIALGVANALAIPNAQGFKDNLDKMLADLKLVPLMGAVAEILATGVIKVTALGIDTQAGIYKFGFGVDLTARTGDESKAGGIKVDAFGLLFTYTKPKSADPE